jgi:hypothetical protein
MRSTTPTIHCDGDDGECGRWDVDWYEATASTVSGVRITATTRAPGWTSTDDSDLCPDHGGGS